MYIGIFWIEELLEGNKLKLFRNNNDKAIYILTSYFITENRKQKTDGELDELMEALLDFLKYITESLSTSTDGELDELMEALLDSLKNITESLSTSTSQSKIATLMDVGFSRERCNEALQENSR